MVDGGLDDTLGGPGRGGMRGDAEVDQATPAEREYDEDVEDSNLAVRTVKKSHPHVSCRWLRMKVVHRCPRPRLNPEGLYLETVGRRRR